MHRIHALARSIGALLLLFPYALGQQEQRPAQFKAAVNLVTVDIIVTDKRGGYPANLKAEDFEVYENGVRQQIRDFLSLQTHIEETGQAPTTEASPRQPAPVSVTATPRTGIALRIAPSERRLFILLFDNLNSQWSNLSQVRAAIEVFLSTKLQPQDLVAIVSVSDSFNVAQNFTRDRQKLLAAAQRILLRSVEGTMAKSSGDYLMDEAQRAADAAAQSGNQEDQILADMLLAQAVSYQSQQNDFSARGSLAALQRVCEALRNIHGRKAVILISEGFALTQVARSNMPRAIDAANKANVAVYTINPRGLEIRDASQQPVSMRQSPRQRSFQSIGRVMGGNSDFDLIALEARTNTDDDGLQDLSQSTGGLAFRNSNDFRKGLETVQHDSHSYYQLTYVPSNNALDGTFRRIDVKVALKGLAIRARRGYFALGQATGFVGTVEDQMYQGLFAVQTLEGLSLSALPAVFLSPSGDLLARITIHADAQGITLVRKAGRSVGGLKFLGGIFDDRGRLVRDCQRDFQLSFEEPAHANFISQGARWPWDVILAPGKYQVKIVIRESGSGNMGSHSEYLEVPSCMAGSPYLSSIVLASQTAPAREEEDPKGLGRQAYNPLRFGSEIIFPAIPRTFSREGMLTFFLHAYYVADKEDPKKSPYLYQVTLFRDSEPYNRSNRYPLEGWLLHPANGFLLAAQLPTADLPPGNYNLELEVALPDGSNRVARHVSFKLF